MPNQEVAAECFHCGEAAGDHPIVAEDKTFCCEGCRTVFDILSENNLCQYYEVGTAGIQGRELNLQQFALLDQPEIAQRFLEFSNESLNKARFFLPQIHCSSCIWLLENLHELVGGVQQVRVHFLKKEAYITYNPQEAGLKEIAAWLDKLGYTPDISQQANANEKSNRQKADSLVFKIGVAGFCFGNVMLLSFPEYLAGSLGMELQFSRFFSHLNLLLALPVLFYAGSDYLKAAYKSLRQKTLVIDVPVAIGMVALFARSAYEILTQSGAGYMDSFTGLVFFLLIGKWFQQKTYQALSFERDYRSYFPLAVARMVDGQEEATALEKIEVGDTIKVRNEELIPADAILLEGAAAIDYSFVTGESLPVKVLPGDIIQAGGKQLGSSLTLKVMHPVSQSYLTRLWEQKAFGQDKMIGWTNLVDRVSKVFTPAILLVAVVAGISWYFIDPSRAWEVFTAVLIVACPCALALTLPFAYGHAIRLLGRKGCYLRDAAVAEKMGEIDTLVFDKTGTLTLSRKAHVDWVGKPLSESMQQAIASLADQSSHPLSRAVVAQLNEPALLPVTDFQEIPGHGLEGHTVGATLRLGKRAWVVPTPQPGTTSSQEESSVYVSTNGQLLGHFSIANQYREGTTQLLKTLRPEFDLHLLSGDGGWERQRLIPLIGAENQLHFEQSPAQKMDYVSWLQKAGKQVLMAGDGLNDAGALQQADIGVAVADDVYAFSPACDVILHGSQFGSLDNILHFAQSVRTIVRASFVLSFLYNAVGLLLAVQGYLTPLVAAILMPLSSVTVVGFITAMVYWKGGKLLSNGVKGS